MNSNNYLLSFQHHFIFNFLWSSSFNGLAFAWHRIFRKVFLSVIYSTSLEFVFWILLTKTYSSSFCIVTQGIFSNFSSYAWYNVQCISTYFALFWIEVVAFNSLLTISVSAKVICSDDFTNSVLQFELCHCFLLLSIRTMKMKWNEKWNRIFFSITMYIFTSFNFYKIYMLGKKT